MFSGWQRTANQEDERENIHTGAKAAGAASSFSPQITRPVLHNQNTSHHFSNIRFTLHNVLSAILNHYVEDLMASACAVRLLQKLSQVWKKISKLFLCVAEGKSTTLKVYSPIEKNSGACIIHATTKETKTCIALWTRNERLILGISVMVGKQSQCFRGSDPLPPP